MTIAALQASLLSLTGYQSDLQFALSRISNERTVLAYQASLLGEQLSQTDPDVNISNNAQYQALQWKDRQLELRQKTFETQTKAVEQQISSTQKAIDSNTSKDFKIGFQANG